MLAVVNSLSSFANKASFQLKRHAPEIMVGAGIVSGAATVVLACIATVKAGDVVGGAKTELEAIEDTRKKFDDYTDEAAKKDRRKVYLRTAGELAGLYAPAVGTGVASTALILGGTGMLNKRNAVLASSLATTLGEFKEYRKNLIERFGDEGETLDKELRHGIKSVEVKEKTTDENGKTKTSKKTLKVIESEDVDCNGYSRVFDWRNPYWDKDQCYCELFLRAKQSHFNDKLRADGHVFLNDVLKELGFPTTRAGQEVGWIYNPNSQEADGDNYIDFGMVPVCVDVEGYRQVYMLDFNVDGSVLNKVDWPDQKK